MFLMPYWARLVLNDFTDFILLHSYQQPHEADVIYSSWGCRRDRAGEVAHLGSQPQAPVKPHFLKNENVTVHLCAEAGIGKGSAVTMRGSLQCTSCTTVPHCTRPNPGSCNISKLRK